MVLNFARNGEDGKPTVYITEGRDLNPSFAAAGGPLMYGGAPLYTESSFAPVPLRGASLNELSIPAASAATFDAAAAVAASAAASAAPAEEAPAQQQSSSCCFTSTCFSRQAQQPLETGAGAEGDREAAPVDVVLSAAYPLAADKKIAAGSLSPKVEPPADACIIGQYFKGCCGPQRTARNTQTPPQWQQVRNISMLFACSSDAS